MVLESIRSNKNSLLRRCLVIFVLVSVLLFSGCDPRSGNYPFQIAGKWYSEDPQISLSYHKNSNAMWSFNHTLIWEHEELQITIGMQSSYYCVYPADSNHYDDRLFSGSWKYRNGNLVLKVEEDFIFDGEYSRIILKPLEENTTS